MRLTIQTDYSFLEIVIIVMCIYKILNTCLLLAASCGTAQAQLALNVEELQPHMGRFKLDVSLAYANAQRTGLAAGSPIVVQTGSASFITLPARVGERSLNTDTVVLSMGLRYGLSPQTELYVRTGGLHNSQRSAALGRSESRSASGFVDAWAGVSYRFATRPNKATWIGFAEVALREKHRSTSTSLKSTVLGFTTYQAFDPVVLSFTGAWRLNQKRHDGAQHYQPGHLLMFHPSLAFSVNDRITLNGRQLV